MKKKFITTVILAVLGFMVFAPAANAANVYCSNSKTGPFQSLKSSAGENYKSFLNNIFYSFTKNPGSDNTNTQDQSQLPVEPQKPEQEQTVTQPKEDQQPAQPKENNEPNNIVSADELEMLEYINEERTKAGVSPLQMDTEVARVAQIKSQDMVDNNYFSHTSPTYGSPFDMMRDFDISFKAAGENIAINSTVIGAHNAFMNSQGHRENILNPNYTHVGIGIVDNGSGITVTQMFIAK